MIVQIVYAEHESSCISLTGIRWRKNATGMNQKIEAPTLEDSDMAQGLSTFYDKATNIVDSN